MRDPIYPSKASVFTRGAAFLITRFSFMFSSTSTKTTRLLHPVCTVFAFITFICSLILCFMRFLLVYSPVTTNVGIFD